MQKFIFRLLALFCIPFSIISAGEKWCVIVDGCSTGKYYAPYFKKDGYQCAHVTTPGLPLLINTADYDLALDYDGNLENLLASLQPVSVEHVVAGSEPGLELAEQIATALGVEKNEPGFAVRSRDKYMTGETLAKNGLRSIKQAKVHSFEEASKWLDNHQKWPVVVKPLDSAGSDGFRFCQNRSEVQKAVETLLKQKMLFGKLNTELLIQEYIAGPEYIINTVSCEGQHYVQSFMIYEKRETAEGGLIFETYSLLDPSECAEAKQMFQYTFNVLDALGIRFGPAHSEVFLTPEGPVLVECGARPHGNSYPDDLMIQSAGQSQVELGFLAYTHPEKFRERTVHPYRLRKHMTVVRLASLQEGIIKAIHFLDEIEKLPSFYLHRIHKKPGDFLPKTEDLQTLAGDIFLCSENKKQLMSDIAKIRHLEKIGIFEISSPE